MLAGRIALLVISLGTAGVVATACSGDSRPPGNGTALGASNATSATGSGGSNAADTGGAAGASGGSSAGGMGGQAGQLGEGGTGLEPPDAGVCGDGSVGLTEECEPGVALVVTCSSLGFESGVLRCGEDCIIDTSDCRGTESCADGRDNDGDGRADCADSECEADCAQSCETPLLVADGSSITASSEGRAAQLTSSCAGGGGPEIVAEVSAQTTGKLDARVSGRGLMALSLRTSCADDASEVACVLVDERGGLSVDVSSGQVLFAVVEGYSGAVTGNVTLEVASRAANVCGDSFIDGSEECDDGGDEAGDACSATCQVEVTESEPNDSAEEAEAYSEPSYALISPEGDADYYALSIDDGPKAVTLDVLDVASGFCSGLEMDPYLELFDDAGQLVAANDDGGDGYCSRLVVPALDDGEYLVVVRQSESATGATRATFGYELSVSTD